MTKRLTILLATIALGLTAVLVSPSASFAGRGDKCILHHECKR
jgi:hypothetical protein